MPFGNDVLLGHVVAAASHAESTSGVVVVTSDHSSDDRISEWCTEREITHWRGPLEDVASRMLAAAHHYGAQGFVRISGDSPMLDPSIVTAACVLFSQGSHDLVTNVHPRSFPPGQSVEVIRTSILDRLLRGGDVTVYDREHVTSILYRHSGELRVGRLEPDGNLETEPPLTIDTPEDAERFRLVIRMLGDEPAWPLGWRRCSELSLQAARELVSQREVWSE